MDFISSADDEIMGNVQERENEEQQQRNETDGPDNGHVLFDFFSKFKDILVAYKDELTNSGNKLKNKGKFIKQINGAISTVDKSLRNRMYVLADIFDSVDKINNKNLVSDLINLSREYKETCALSEFFKCLEELSCDAQQQQEQQIDSPCPAAPPSSPESVIYAKPRTYTGFDEYHQDLVHSVLTVLNESVYKDATYEYIIDTFTLNAPLIKIILRARKEDLRKIYDICKNHSFIHLRNILDDYFASENESPSS